MTELGVQLISGSAAGCSNVLFGLPFDTVKVKMQTYPQVYSSFFTTLKLTYTTEGIFKGFYAGYKPSLLANVSENAVLFFAYGFCQTLVSSVLKTDIENMNTLSKAISGSMASVFSSCVLCPTEMIKCRLQVHRELYPSVKMTMTDVIKSVYSTSGLLGFFLGLKATWMREIPGYFALFYGYEASRTGLLMLSSGTSSDALTPIQTVFCGGVGGLTYWSCVFPMDSIKSRIQVLNLKETSVFSEGFRVIKSEGIKGLYKGVSAALLRSFPSTGALFLTLETTKTLLNKKFGLEHSNADA